MPPAGALSSEGALSGWEAVSWGSAVVVLVSELASSDALSGWLLEESALDRLSWEEDGWELAGSPAEQACDTQGKQQGCCRKTQSFHGFDLPFWILVCLSGSHYRPEGVPCKIPIFNHLP